MQQYRAFSRVQRGQRHMQTGTVCQDFALATDAAPDCSVIVVADGHGGADYPRSDRGARFAVQAAAATLMEFASAIAVGELRDLAARRDLLRALFDGILSRWHEAIAADLFDDPFAETQLEDVHPTVRAQYMTGEGVARAYGTTLIAALVTDRYFLGLHQGDGRCVAVRPDGTCEQPIAWDKRCQDNRTTSLCDTNARDEFRHCFSERLPAAVFLCTDGVDGAYPDMDGVYGLCQALSSVYLRDGRPGLERVVAEHLPNLSRHGGGDDATIAGLLCVDKLMPVSAVLHLEEQLRKASALWDQASRQAKEHDLLCNQVKRTLQQQRETISHIEGLAAQQTDELEQETERLQQLERSLKARQAMLTDLSRQLEEARTQEQETAERDAWLVREQQRFQLQMEEAAHEVEQLMDASEKERQHAIEQLRKDDPSAHLGYTEDFTEPWAFVNRCSDKSENNENAADHDVSV